MEIRQEILFKYLEQAATEQIKEEYLTRGYEVDDELVVEGVHPDLVVKKGEDLIVFEVKAGLWEQEKRKQVTKIRNVVIHELKGRFELVFANIPEPPEIDIEDMEVVLVNSFIETYQHLYDDMSTHTRVVEVVDIQYSSVSIQKSKTVASGQAIVGFELQYGSHGDHKKGDGYVTYESKVFNFSVSLINEVKSAEVEEIYFTE